ncbi:MAG: hypothetical protein IKP47_08905 [Ruminococcus sp.]|nr:hypothetical protein [Ruminococcus sp.]
MTPSLTLDEFLLCKQAIMRYGKQGQMIVAIEELSELIKEITKNLRGRDNCAAISEEMADVYIMLEQLIMMFDNDNEIRGQMRLKMKCLKERMDNERGGEL